MRMMTSSKLTWETKNNKICDETAALKYIDIEFILYNICQSFQVFIMSASGLCVVARWVVEGGLGKSPCC